MRRVKPAPAGGTPGLHILGTGSAVPERRVTNAMLETLVETSDAWIQSRTGIRERRFADGETVLGMAAAAARRALETAGLEPAEIGLLLCATLTNEYVTPSLSCRLQRELGLREDILAFDVNAACSGFVYGLEAARALLPGRGYALVTGSEMLSRLLDFTDRGTCVLFGDGAGAAVLSLRAEKPFYFDAGARGDERYLRCPAVWAGRSPFSGHAPPDEAPFLRMDGQEVFRFAVDSVGKSVNAVLRAAGARADEIDHYVLHQANERILRGAAKKLGLPPDRFFMNLSSYGNTSAASIPLALDELNQSGALARGDRLVLAGFGGGMTYGAAYLVW